VAKEDFPPSNQKWSDSRKFHPNRTCTTSMSPDLWHLAKELLIQDERGKERKRANSWYSIKQKKMRPFVPHARSKKLGRFSFSNSSTSLTVNSYHPSVSSLFVLIFYAQILRRTVSLRKRLVLLLSYDNASFSIFLVQPLGLHRNGEFFSWLSCKGKGQECKWA